jgi:hypothetical protein
MNFYFHFLIGIILPIYKGAFFHFLIRLSFHFLFFLFYLLVSILIFHSIFSVSIFHHFAYSLLSDFFRYSLPCFGIFWQIFVCNISWINIFSISLFLEQILSNVCLVTFFVNYSFNTFLQLYFPSFIFDSTFYFYFFFNSY